MNSEYQMVMQNDIHAIKKAFHDYPVFSLYLRYAYKNMDTSMYVDDIKNPKTFVLIASPGVLVHGTCNQELIKDLQHVIPVGSWIISPNQEWDDFLKTVFGDSLDSFPRVQMDASTLDINLIRAARKPIPDELKIEPIEEKHFGSGMLQHEIISRFFQKRSFLQNGFGLALTDGMGRVHGYAATNYPLDESNEIEVSFRVGYNDFEKYRHQGIATTLASFFLEEAMSRGFVPQWDAANEVSAHIAQKFGYKELFHWNMHHIKNKLK